MKTPDSIKTTITRLRATKAQERIFKLYQLGKRFRSIHNMGAIFRLQGHVDLHLLRKAIQDVMQCHAMLRSTFCIETDGLFLDISPAGNNTAPIESHPIASMEPPVLAALFRETIKRPFDIFQTAPWRFYHFYTTSGQSTLILSIHHLISDYQTVAIIIKELIYYYNIRAGRTPNLYQSAFISDELAQQHFAAQEIAGRARYEQEARERIQHVRPLNLFNRSVGLLQRSFDFGYAQCLIPATLTQCITAISTEYQLPASALYLAAYALLLSETANQNEFLVGFTTDNRSDKKNLRAAGFLSSPSLLKINVEDSHTILEFCQRNAKELRRAFRTRFVPLADVFQSTSNQQSAGLQALFSFVMLPFETDSTSTITPDRILTGMVQSDLDVCLTIVNKNSDLYVMLELSLDLTDQAAIEPLTQRYIAILKWITAHPLALIDSALEQQQKTALPSLDLMASFAIDPLVNPTQFWCAKSGLTIMAHTLGYQMVLPRLLGLDGDNPSSMACFCLLRPDDFFKSKATAATDAEFNELLEQLAQALTASILRRQIPHFVLICPTIDPSPQTISVEHRLVARLTSVPALLCLDLTTRCRPDEFSIEREHLAHIPYHDEFYDFLAIEIARQTYLIQCTPIKVIVLDCDNTLWHGVIGEEGINGVSLDAGHLALQQKIVELHNAGVLITLASKNDSDIVESFFRQRKDTILKWHHFAATKISWDAKTNSILSLATELNLGLDSFLFLDDNPLEILDVQHGLPDVLCIRIPHDVSVLESFISNLWPLSTQTISKEDRQRSAHYQTETQRQAFAQQQLSYADFIAGLNVKVDFLPLTSDNLVRACQISQRTNQFNLTTIRYSESMLLVMLDAPDYVVRLVSCEDRFGAYGEIGLLVARRQGLTLEAETFALSCRAMGRGVEIEMLRELGRIGLALHLDTLVLRASKTARNTPAINFVRALDELGESESADDRVLLRLAMTMASQVNELPTHAPNHPHPNPLPPAGEGVVQRDRVQEAERLHWIALHSAYRHHAQQRNVIPAPPGSGQSIDYESIVRTIWIDLIKRPPSHPTETFTAAGLDSLGAIDFALRLEKACGIKLSLDIFYAAQSFNGICALIKQRNHTIIQHQIQAQMLADMELPYDEVPALIQQPSTLSLAQAQHVLLTGATGFVGAHLLIELLKTSTARIVCLIRSESTEIAKEKLLGVLTKYKLAPPEKILSRIDILAGDLAEENLGLNQITFDKWAAQIDIVIHCGAEVNFYAPYLSLRSANVLGTRTLLRFSVHQKIKPFHFISTIGVFHSYDASNLSELPESAASVSLNTLPTGYQQSKVVAEALLARARERGMPVTVIRLGTMGGSSQTGCMNTKDFLVSLIALAHQISAMPIMRNVDFLPVDFAGQAITAIVNRVHAYGKFFNVVHPTGLPIHEIERWYVAAGQKMQVQHFDDWVETITRFLTNQPHHHFTVFVPMIASRLLDILLNAPKACSHNTNSLLEQTGIGYPPLDEALFELYLANYKELGWLPN